MNGVNEQLIAILGMGLAVVLLLILAATLFIIVLAVSRRRERLAGRAIDAGQTEVAREIVRRNPQWILWIFLGLVALAIVSSLPWWANLVVAIVGITTFHVWYPALAGRESNGGGKGKAGTAEKQEGLEPPPPKSEVDSPSPQN